MSRTSHSPPPSYHTPCTSHPLHLSTQAPHPHTSPPRVPRPPYITPPLHLPRTATKQPCIPPALQRALTAPLCSCPLTHCVPPSPPTWSPPARRPGLHLPAPGGWAGPGLAHGTAWHSTARTAEPWHGAQRMAWHGMVQHGTVQYIQHGTAQHSTDWHSARDAAATAQGAAWHSTTHHGKAQPGMSQCTPWHTVVQQDTTYYGRRRALRTAQHHPRPGGAPTLHRGCTTRPLCSKSTFYCSGWGRDGPAEPRVEAQDWEAPATSCPVPRVSSGLRVGDAGQDPAPAGQCKPSPAQATRVSTAAPRGQGSVPCPTATAPGSCPQVSRRGAYPTRCGRC